MDDSDLEYDAESNLNETLRTFSFEDNDDLKEKSEGSNEETEEMSDEGEDEEEEEEEEEKYNLPPISNPSELYLNKKDSKSKQNKTFTYFQIREIDQGNVSLVKRVLSHTNRTPKFKTDNLVTKVSSAEINRKKLQKKIDHDNLVSFKIMIFSN